MKCRRALPCDWRNSLSDRKHFDSYRVQTLLKHKIIEGYLPHFFIAHNKDRLAYFDAFAGRGSYTKNDGSLAPGSPVRAIELIAAQPKLRDRVIMIFAEPDRFFHEELNKAVNTCESTALLAHKPVVVCMDFASVFEEIKRTIAAQVVPTFLFVDPCGVKGVRFQAIEWFLSQPGSELFMFFNSSGLRRVIGAADDKANREILNDYFGKSSRVDDLLQAVSATASSADRESITLSHFVRAIQTIRGVKYVLPFRVEHEDRSDTSHYLIHATKHPLGFRLMKYVMRDYLAINGLTDGELELRQASYEGIGDLFAGSKIEMDIVESLRDGPKQAKHFYHVRTELPDNYWSERDYKNALLGMESTGRLQVFKDEGLKEPYPAEKRMRVDRRTKLKTVTLGKDCWLSPIAN